MLVLSRKAGEVITIGDEITIVIKAIHGKTASVAIQAPKEVKIRRSELKPKERPDA